ILRHELYVIWLGETNDSQFLWISGNPGCGKTVLSRFSLDTIEQSLKPLNQSSRQRRHVLYFFFDDKYDTLKSTESLLRSLIHQLIELVPDLIQHAMPYYASCQEKIVDSLDILRKFFCGITTDHRYLDGVYLVVDALDECEETSRKKLIERFEQCFASRESNCQNPTFLKGLATSRPYSRIESLLHPSFCIRLRTEENEDNINQDIRAFILHEVGRLETECYFDDLISQEIVESLTARADRMFLWVSLIIQDLRYTPIEEIRDKLRSIPSGLDCLYQQLLVQICSWGPSISKLLSKILMWVLNVPRPMHIDELAWACTVNDSHRSASSVDISVINGFSQSIGLRGPILKLDNGGIVKLVHQSAKDYLQQQNVSSLASPIIPLPLHSCHYHFALTCLTYLAFEEFAQQSLIDGLVMQINFDDEHSADHMTEIARRFPLLRSAAKYRSQFMHDTNTGDSSEGDELWKAIYIYNQGYFDAGEMNALIIATFFDLRDFVFRLVNVNLIHDIDFQIVGSNGSKQTAPSIAICCGHGTIARFLIKKGADINFRNVYGETLLASSASARYINVFQLLLEKGIKVNTKGGHYGNALQAAAANGHENIVKLLFGKGMDVNAEGGLYGNSLQAWNYSKSRRNRSKFRKSHFINLKHHKY
ncbi:hypothetical protein FPQ18DRAFT_262731, partial [Pyronema domesticum]